MRLSTAVFCLLVVWVGSLYGSPLRHIVLHNHVIQTHQVAPTVHSDMHGSQDLQWMVHVSNVFSSQEKSELNRAISPFEFGIYLPHNTYLLVAPRDVIKKVEKHPSVLWVGAFLPEYKLSKNFEQSAANAKKPVLVVLLPPQSPETKNKRTNEQAQAIAEDWVSRFTMPGVSISARANRGDKIIVQVTPIKKLHEVGVWLSQQPESHFIEVTRPQKFNNLYAGNAVKTGSMDSTPVLSYINSQLNGSSQIIGIADSGLDFASCYFSDGQGANDTTVFDRKVVRYATYPGAGDRLDADGHGTFVAGTILGSTTSSPQNNSNGIAPAAKVYFWDISANGVEFADTENFRSNVLDYYDETLGDLNEDINTWLFTFGSPVEWYSTFSADIDGFMHEYPDYVVVVPAGNDGQSLIEAALSKNAIVVGASQSFPEALSNPLSSTGGPIDTSNAALWGTQALASFSAKGPTPDGRLKPDIVAPGQRITSSLNGVSCATSVRQGTSYAAAVAAGAAAIVRDYFAKAFYPYGIPDSDPPLYTIASAALVKAMLINSGQSLLVGDADGQGHFVSLANAWPSSIQGYGRIQLDQVLYFDSSTFNMSALADDVPPLQQGDTYRTCLVVYPGSSNVKITLVWTDPPGSPTAGISLINDLDVVLYDQRGNTWKATTGNGEFDTINNVEQIYVPNLPPGTYSISFHGARVTTTGGQSWVAVTTANNADLTSTDSFCTKNFDNSTHPLCANGCSGHGTCTSISLNSGQFLSYCACNAGFSGVDCSKSSCIANCNGNGVCNYITSTCSCNLNYDPADGCVTLLPDVVVPPTPPPVVIVQSASDPLPYYIGIGVAAFVFGALVLGVAGFFGAVKYLEYRRDKAAMSKNTEMKT